MKVGDLVVLRKGWYNFAPEQGKARWTFTDTVGIITDNRGFVDGTAEYKVYTADGKHMWEHADDLRPTGDESADPLGRERDDDESR